ncbi:hypothetical protein ACEN9F_25540 [Duganella sp. CT11-25]|jgi:hypothetical protein|uniref:hypothetical protein n=1 Tax=unclassified Duganella TaxID=2636909 RepID=UPI0039B06319
MKTIIAAVAALAALTGCAAYPPGYYATTTRVQDPYQWHTVGPASGGAQSGTWTEELPAQSSRVVYTTEPAYTTTYVAQPVYYAPAPVYYAPAPSYYYPPVSIGLDFVFSNRGYRGWGGRGGYHRR